MSRRRSRISAVCINYIATKCILHRTLLTGKETIPACKHESSTLSAPLSVCLLHDSNGFYCFFVGSDVIRHTICPDDVPCVFSVFFSFVSFCELLAFFLFVVGLFSLCQAVIMKTNLLLIDLLYCLSQCDSE